MDNYSFAFGATLAFFRPPNGAKNFPQKNRLGLAPFLQPARFYFHLFFNDDFRPNGVDAFAALILKRNFQKNIRFTVENQKNDNFKKALKNYKNSLKKAVKILQLSKPF